MEHDFSLVFETENPLWQRVLSIFEKNEKYDKKVVKNRNLHHKFPRSFSKLLGENVDNDKDNLISLSLADHFLVHYYYYLLAKKGFRQRMALAFTFMAKKSLKYVTPETAEAMAKDYAEAKAISEQTRGEAISRKLKGRTLSEEVKKRISIGHVGHKHSSETKKKQSESAKNAATPELCKLRSETRKGVSHPHRSGRKGLPLSEFGKLFYEHYGFTSSEHAVLYRQELHYWREHNKHCSWDEINVIYNKEVEK